MTSNVLDPSSILHKITQNLPNTLQSPYDALMAASHAAMLSVGFKFAGLGDDARQEGDGTQTKLPEEWNAQGPHVYSIRYSHPQSSMTFVIKSLKLGNKWIVHGLGIDDNKTATLELNVDDYTSQSFYPYTASSEQPLVHGFISSSRFNDLLVLYKINIIQRLMPGLAKPGYSEESTSSTTTTTSTEPQRQQPNRTQPPSSEVPYPRPPIFDDPTSPDRPFSGVSPSSVGRDDLNPLGGPLGSLRPLGSGTGGGMFVGPDHPIFGGGRNDLDDPAGVFGGPQPLPRGAVPPGARFDPIGPFGGNPGRGGGRGGRGRGRGNFGGEPDNDELPPPGYNDMFM
ncbi:PI31 proteasome regulator N-terminal-domain-containing protein [Absidia repens]|uniref:PI31 proteasome regulator N-terminal-domain-containing protein n=1 Tax=Absidia repens TaxID=90262 RepID=A0A1X2IGS1_9FUNG|nr:PI31 proteasome regulator N-terminal-domain-containing protein [Absidia repens]